MLERSVAYTHECLDRFGYVTHNDLRLRAVRRAVVTERCYDMANRAYTGAVYDGADALIADSLRFNHGDINPVDPVELPPGIRQAAEANARQVGIYAGALFPILGHFLFEALARLWPLTYLAGAGGAVEPADIVVHDWPGLDLSAFFDNKLYATLFAALGVTRERIVLADRPLLYDTLIVADPASRYHVDMNAEMDRMLDFTRRFILGTDIPRISGDKLYLSRSRWSANRRVVNEAAIDEAVTARGYRVVYPELLDPAELVAVLAGASAVVSFDGSHAHLGAFCEPDTAMVLFDTRPVPTQIAIAKLRGFRIMHVPLFELAGLYQVESGILDIDGLCAMAEHAIRERLVSA